MRRESDGMEITQQKITRTLQQIDANFSKALAVASQMTNEVKSFKVTMRQISVDARRWRGCLDAFATVEARPATQTAAAEPVAASSAAATAGGSAGQQQQQQQQQQPAAAGDSTGTSVETPSFKTSFAQGIGGGGGAGAAGGGAAAASAIMECGGSESGDSLRVGTPATITKMYHPSKTPGGGDSDISISGISSVGAISPMPALSGATTTPGVGQARPAAGAAANEPSAKRAATEEQAAGGAASSSAAAATSRTPAAAAAAMDASLSMRSPGTPSFGSPLLASVKLAPMTPKTPISNRLAIQKSAARSAARSAVRPQQPAAEEEEAPPPPQPAFEVGTLEEEALIGELEEMENEPAPEFSLDILPAFLRAGEGALQVTELYSRFSGASATAALSMAQLHELLPDMRTDRIALLVETLVSRRLLRPFHVSGTMYWQRA